MFYADDEDTEIVLYSIYNNYYKLYQHDGWYTWKSCTNGKAKSWLAVSYLFLPSDGQLYHADDKDESI